MKLAPFAPQDSVFWYNDRDEAQPLTQNITTDVTIVGGGMAGLMAAQSFAQKGCKVVLIEKNYCGAGASGKSSGFITPDSELSLSDIVEKYEPAQGKNLWEFIQSGVTAIQKNIVDYDIDCDYQLQDTLIVSNTKKAFTKTIEAEHKARLQFNYQSNLYTQQELPAIIGSSGYTGGISYGDSFGINGYQYCRAMKKVLQDAGVMVYEETPMIALDNTSVTTPRATITTSHTVICMDRYAEHIPTCADKVYHAQTFLMISEPLSDAMVSKIFPKNPCMVWDTELIYNYFRLTGDNRLLLGGASLWNTYQATESYHNTRILKQLTNYFHKKFPEVTIKPAYFWPGLIGISKDLFPIAGFDKDMPNVYYVSAAAGLPWAAALGRYSAECQAHANNPFNAELSPYRATPLNPLVEKIVGTKLSFALSNFLSVSSL